MSSLSILNRNHPSWMIFESTCFGFVFIRMKQSEVVDIKITIRRDFSRGDTKQESLYISLAKKIAMLGLRLLGKSPRQKVALIELEERKLTNEIGRLRFLQRNVKADSWRHKSLERRIRVHERQNRKLGFLKDKYMRKIGSDVPKSHPKKH